MNIESNRRNNRIRVSRIPLSLLIMSVLGVWMMLLSLIVIPGVASAAKMQAGPILEPDFPINSPNTFDTTKSFELPTVNNSAYGLAYRDDTTPHRLYVSDQLGDEIFVYEIHSDGLQSVSEDILDPEMIDPDFFLPRDLGYQREYGVPYIYAITSNNAGNSTRDSRLWRINLNNPDNMEFVDLTASAFGINNAEVDGLTIHNGIAYISYDTSGFSSEADQVQKGILKLRISSFQSKGIWNLFSGKPYRTMETAKFQTRNSQFRGGRKKAPQSAFTPVAPKTKFSINWWYLAQQGASSAVVEHIPHSGRKVNGNSTYSRAPSFGLAFMEIDGEEYLWGTSYNKYLYLAQAESGRGIFAGDSPGEKKATGLAFGDGYLWVVDRVSGIDQIHRVHPGYTNDDPIQTGRAVRHIYMEIASKSTALVLNTNLQHHFAVAHDAEQRPSQDRDGDLSFEVSGASHSVESYHYDPAGETADRQHYRRVQFSGSFLKNKEITSAMEMDVWTSKYRQFVYPQRVNELDQPDTDYTNNSSSLYDLSDTDAYETFLNAIEDAIVEEYGPGALSDNPYWRARDILEFIVENYDYGNVKNPSVGHYSYQPASIKIGLPFDGSQTNDKMSCSTSTFALSGVMRYMGYPTRWIGTTKQRSSWDANDDGLFSANESAVDDDFHRWAEVWMGSHYGWQRFDPTPSSDGPRQHSQYELMSRAAQGVNKTDLVLTIGNGKQSPFFDEKGQNQRYNTQTRFNNPSLWEIVEQSHIVWTNATFLEVAPSPSFVMSPSTTVEWSTSGRWDLDPTANVSIYLQRYELEDGQYTEVGSKTLMAKGIHHEDGMADIDLSEMESGPHRFIIVKSNDHETGDAGDIFHISKAQAIYPL